MEDLGHQTSSKSNTLASSIILMAIFTPGFAIWTVFEWLVPAAVFVTATMGWSIYLGAMAYRLLLLSSELPQDPDDDNSRSTRVVIAVGIMQAAAIGVVIISFTFLDLVEWMLPVAAVLVTPTFFISRVHMQEPAGNRVGPYMLIVAAVGFFLAAIGLHWQTVAAITGLGGTLVAWAASVLMVREARELLTE